MEKYVKLGIWWNLPMLDRFPAFKSPVSLREVLYLIKCPKCRESNSMRTWMKTELLLKVEFRHTEEAALSALFNEFGSARLFLQIQNFEICSYFYTVPQVCELRVFQILLPPPIPPIDRCHCCSACHPHLKPGSQDLVFGKWEWVREGEVTNMDLWSKLTIGC